MGAFQMGSFEQEAFLRDILLSFAALIGLLYILVINLKDYWVRPGVFSKKNKDKSQFDPSKTDWKGDNLTSFKLNFDEPHTIWEINLFSMRMIHKEKLFSTFKGFPWFEFSKSQVATEKIMSPILRKIFMKYRSKFEKVHPIHVTRVSRESIHLYTWLQNETHTNTAVFNFLDEALLIASEAKIYPSLSIIWDDVIFIEALFPSHPLLINLEKEFENTQGIDYHVTYSQVSLKLWLAFSIEKIPSSLKEKENKIHKKSKNIKVS